MRAASTINASGLTITFRRSYAIELDGAVIGFVRGPKRWDGYAIGHGWLAPAFKSRSQAAEAIVATINRREDNDH